MSPERPRAVLFDWDNTLVDTFPVIHAAYNETLAAMGMAPWTYEETCERVARSMRDAFPTLFGERWREAHDVFYASYRANHLAKITPLSGAVELIEALAGTGAWLAVLSNKRGDTLRREAAHLGWDRHFGRIVGATDAARDKPAPEAVDLALSGSGVAAGPEVWLVGDNAIDVDCAEASGCLPILVRGAVRTGSKIARDRVRFRFDSRAALTSLVNRL